MFEAILKFLKSLSNLSGTEFIAYLIMAVSIINPLFGKQLWYDIDLNCFQALDGFAFTGLFWAIKEFNEGKINQEESGSIQMWSWFSLRTRTVKLPTLKKILKAIVPVTKTQTKKTTTTLAMELTKIFNGSFNFFIIFYFYISVNKQFFIN